MGTTGSQWTFCALVHHHDWCGRTYKEGHKDVANIANTPGRHVVCVVELGLSMDELMRELRGSRDAAAEGSASAIPKMRALETRSERRDTDVASCPGHLEC
jgi:hypothetical protein